MKVLSLAGLATLATISTQLSEVAVVQARLGADGNGGPFKIYKRGTGNDDNPLDNHDKDSQELAINTFDLSMQERRDITKEVRARDEFIRKVAERGERFSDKCSCSTSAVEIDFLLKNMMPDKPHYVCRTVTRVPKAGRLIFNLADAPPPTTFDREEHCWGSEDFVTQLSETLHEKVGHNGIYIDCRTNRNEGEDFLLPGYEAATMAENLRRYCRNQS